jgi:hypothetical protein
MFFSQLGRSIRTHSRWDGSRLVEQQQEEVAAEGSRHGRKWRRGRGKWHGHGRRRAAHGQPEARR